MVKEFASEIMLPLVGISVGLMIIGIFFMLFILLARMIYLELFSWRKKR